VSNAPARKSRLKSLTKRLRTNVNPDAKRVQLRLVNIEVWSAARAGFFVTVAIGVATIVGFFAMWLVVGQLGLFASLNTLLAGAFGDGGIDVEQQLSLPRVMSFAFGVSIFNVIVGTALAALYAMIFNVIGKITGGIAVSFTNN
jgi:Transmembrane domain of unknown function (DUF3566)